MNDCQEHLFKWLYNHFEVKQLYLKRLREIREDNDLFQKDIADFLKITTQQYQLYESGKRDIPVDLLIVFSKHFEVSLDYIVELSNNKERRH